MHQRQTKRSRRQGKIQRILDEFRGIKNISNIKCARKEDAHSKGENFKRRNGHMKKRKSQCLRGILQQALCRGTTWNKNEQKKRKQQKGGRKNKNSQKMRCRLSLTASKKGKARYSNGIRAEDIKACDETAKEVIRQIYNEVLKQDDCMAKNLHKSDPQKGGVEAAGNFCQICIVPPLYKLFSTLLYNYFFPDSTSCSRRTRGGFERSYQKLDRLAAYRLTEQECREWVY